MEEYVGQVWHRLITRAARDRFPQAAVTLEEVRPAAGLLFRALGGDGGLGVENATATEHGARRNWLARIAGSGRQVELAWRDLETLRLPATLDCYPDKALNRELYLWLAALAATPPGEEDWFTGCQRRTLRVLERFPGLAARYRRLVAAELDRRPDPARLPPDEAAAERAIQTALVTPGSQPVLPPARRSPQPVNLWLHPCPPVPEDRSSGPAPDPDDPVSRKGSKQTRDRRKRRAERVDDPNGNDGLLAFRLESLFTWGEYVKVDRTTDDDEDPEAERTADDMDVLSISRGDKAPASRLRFDLDLPAADNDDLVLGEGIPLPEWDFRKQQLLPDQCRLIPMVARQAEPIPLPRELAPTARKLRRQFQALVPERTWHRAQPEGSDVDLDAWITHRAGRLAGQAGSGDNLYRDFRGGGRDLACLLLADLSLSTDTYVNDEQRVVDVIRDSLHLFAEALQATGDRFALYGFSSRKRQHVRFNTLKTFDEPLGDTVRGRIQAIRPGYYTRMGAAIRHATGLLEQQKASQRLLILLTDGKPNDLDRYEGRFGAEDTRMAVLEARRAGLVPFCVTVDEEAEDYLPHLFGAGGFVVIRNPLQLPRELPLLYARLTR